MAIAACLLLAAAAGCTTRDSPSASTGAPSTRSSGLSDTGPTTPADTAPTPSVPASTVPAADAAQRSLAAMTEQQRIGQLFMVGNPATGTDPTVLAEIRAGQVGSVFLAGNSTAAASQTAAVASALQQSALQQSALAGRSTRLFVATDQEGGTVQRLKGPDFRRDPERTQPGRRSRRPPNAPTRKAGAANSPRPG